jgi:uncharacterized repeat protein (TIGR03803 family)
MTNPTWGVSRSTPSPQRTGLLWLACALAAVGMVQAQTDTETVLHSFTSPPKGANPYAGVIRDSAGNLYGTTSSGGAKDAGTVFKVNASGLETVLYSFTGGADGRAPYAGVIRDSSGNLYGTTVSGGTGYGNCSEGCGVVFKLTPAGQETVLYSFTGGADGGNPHAGVVRDSSGNLYGTTFLFGTAYVGVVYKLDTSGNETVLHTFTGGVDGGNPTGGVILDSSGNLYGTTYQYGASGAGVVFKLGTSGQLTALYSFTGNADGGYPYAGVIRDSAGNLYGTTPLGGTAGAGVVFKVSASGQETVLHSFTDGADGGYPSAGVIEDSSGNLYGTACAGGTAGAGVVFKVAAGGPETALYSFPGGTDGSCPYAGVIRDSSGNLYGTTYSGGGTANLGLVYEVGASGQETVLYSFPGLLDGRYPYAGVIDSAGNLYGTTYSGGTSDAGIIFKVNPSGHETMLYNFSGGPDGGFPYAGVTRDSSGNLYGTTTYGGADYSGVVFKLNTAGQETVLYTFTGGADGGYPYAGVVLDGAGNLYGTTYGGGASGAGVVYVVSPAGKETVLHSFTGGADGGQPYAGVIFGGASLYGTTSNGGGYGKGVVYKMNTAGSETVLYNFTGIGADGANPYAGVIRDSAGNLYGTTLYGGTWGYGMVYEVEASGSVMALYDFTGGVDGGIPYAGLTLGVSGDLYGTTYAGGTSGSGVVYELSVPAATWQENVLYNFTGGADGGQPHGGVVRDSSGNLYGTTYSGGSASGGVVFEILP